MPPPITATTPHPPTGPVEHDNTATSCDMRISYPPGLSAAMEPRAAMDRWAAEEPRLETTTTAAFAPVVVTLDSGRFVPDDPLDLCVELAPQGDPESDGLVGGVLGDGHEPQTRESLTPAHQPDDASLTIAILASSGLNVPHAREGDEARSTLGASGPDKFFDGRLFEPDRLGRPMSGPAAPLPHRASLTDPRCMNSKSLRIRGIQSVNDCDGSST